METLTLEVEPREGTGKGPARRARAQGRIPAVFYGAKSEGQNLSVDARDFGRRIANLEGTHLIELRSSVAQLDKRMVLLREVQHHPVTGLPVHADFYEVALDQAIAVRVPLHFEGKAAGVALGGILQPILREIEVRCLPTAIPDFIAVDVSPLAIHDAIHVGQLQLPEGVEAMLDDTETVVSVLPPTTEAKAEGEGAEAAAGAAGEGEAKKPEAKKAEPAKKAEAKK
ncbi:50S ribosomal protein L25 [Candidatus Binatia bacterium]|jgi:large subunit ribosomal protein L25|nr:50S ribosomal protein L25 [Candidatus Binatia bacterium]